MINEYRFEFDKHKTATDTEIASIKQTCRNKSEGLVEKIEESQEKM